jgi:DNA repair protein RadC
VDYTIKEMPESERPRERLETSGSSALSDIELIAILLGSGNRELNAKQLASEILSRHPVDRLVDLEIEELKRFRGVSTAKASRIVAAGELARRSESSDREKISSLSDLKSAAGDMKMLNQEELRVYQLSSGNEVISEERYEGDLNRVGLSPRKVIGDALRSEASAIILVHNHPSGKAEPTPADLETTEEMLEACRTVGIELLDHVVVGNAFYSMRRNGDVEFDG